MAPKSSKKKETGVDLIRAFQKSVPANKNCAICKDRGPTYVCTSFNTFVCQVCSGLHREFGHKIKSISLTEWNMIEAQNVVSGGNEVNEKTFLARWSKEALDVPDSTKQDTIRNWIKKVYVEKCYWDSGATAAASQPSLATTNPAASQPSLAGTSQPSTNGGAQNYVAMSTNIACFCEKHNASEKRQKHDQPQEKPCRGCKLHCMTTYKTFTMCPKCSGSANQCMICGDKVEQEQFDPTASCTAIPGVPSNPPAGPMIDLLSGEEEQPRCAESEEKWEANFSTENIPSSPTPAPSDLFASSAAVGSPAQDCLPQELFGDAPVKSVKRKSLVGALSPDCTGNDLDMLDLSFPPTTVEPNEPPVTSPAAGNPGDSIDVNAAESLASDKKVSPEDSSAPLGDRLREAVLSGSEEDIMNLFQVARAPKKVEVVDPARSAKFDALGDEGLNAFFNSASAYAEQESTSASDCGQSVGTVEDQNRDVTQAAENVESPPVAHFFIGDDDEDTTKNTDFSTLSFIPENGDMKPAPQLSAQQLSRMFVQQTQSRSPSQDLQTQLSSMGPQQLQEMQSMINQMLQQQGVPGTAPQQQCSQPPAAPSSQQLQALAQMQQRSQAAMGYPSGSQAAMGYPAGGASVKMAQATPQAAAQFNFGCPEQLNHIVDKMTPRPGNKPRTSVGAVDNVAKFCTPEYAKQDNGASKPPEPFGDLLSAFHEKNLVAGLSR